MDTWNRARLLPDCAFHLPLAVAAARALHLWRRHPRGDRLLVTRRGSLVLQVRAGGDDVLCSRRPQLLRRRCAGPVRSSHRPSRGRIGGTHRADGHRRSAPAILVGLHGADIYLQSNDPVADRSGLPPSHGILRGKQVGQPDRRIELSRLFVSSARPRHSPGQPVHTDCLVSSRLFFGCRSASARCCYGSWCCRSTATGASLAHACLSAARSPAPCPPAACCGCAACARCRR